MSRPMLAPLAGMIAGMLAAGGYAWFLPAATLPLMLVALMLALSISWRPLFQCLLILFFCAWGNLSLQPYLVPQLPLQHISRQSGEEPVAVEGVIAGRMEGTATGSRVCLDTERIYRGRSATPVTGKLLIYVGEGEPECLTGDRVRLLARIRQPENYGLPGEFDLVRFLALKGIYATAYIPKAERLVLIRSGVAHPLQRRMEQAARRIGAFITLHAGKEEGGILRALLIGDRGGVPRGIEDAYTRSGVNHILSISGFHLGIIALCLFQAILLAARSSTAFMLHCNPRRFALLAALPPLAGYLLLTGAAPATLRSFIMIAVCIVALSLERETDTVNSLLLAATLILIGSPPALFDISFQLSFLALWGMVVLTPLLMRPFQKLPAGGLRWGLSFAAASCAAIAATLVPVAFYFQRASVTGVLANFLIIPLMGYGAVVLGVLAIPLSYPVPPLAAWLVKGAAWLVKLANQAVLWLAGFPTLPPWRPSRGEFLLACLILTAATFLPSRRGKALACGVLGVCLAALPLSRHAGGDGTLTVTSFSIGQGDSTLVTFPDGRRMLIDGGGNYRGAGFDVGERLLVPALRTMGVRRIDYLVLTHPHPDHILGLKQVAAQFPVGEFWETGRNSDSADYRELRDALAARQVPVTLVNAASPPKVIAGVTVEPLAPLTTSGSGGQDPNDDSLAFRLRHGRFAVLFTGDIGATVEEALLADPARLRSTVLKVAHHGSRHSSSAPFLRAVAPEVALISAGRGNRFGLPHPETIRRLQDLGIRVCRTDTDGTIEVTGDRTGVTRVNFAGRSHFR